MSIDSWSGADEAWERPQPDRAHLRQDLWLALGAMVVIALGAELMRSLGAFDEEPHGIPWQYLAMASLAALVAFRRSRPVLVTVLVGVHMLVTGMVLPMTLSTLPMQVLYFFLIFSGVSWARDRRALVAAVGLVLTLMVAWLAWTFALGRGVQQMMSYFADEVPEQIGLFEVPVAVVGFTLLNNVLFFGGSILLGQLAWNGARRTAQVVAQAATIEAQSARLRDQAVVAERLRIARELHDVVAHHVSVMGVQAAAARRVMDRDPAAAATALSAVEQSSRDAVGQMRELLGTLRSDDVDPGMPPAPAGAPVPPGDGAGRSAVEWSPSGRSPQPTLAELPALAERASTPTCRASVTVVESAPGAAARVAPPVQLSAYRVVQEAFANVHRHSTARSASAVVRVDEDADRLEVEVVDDGTARVGTSGTGLGLRGMRERAHHLGGGVEVGPRTGSSGWRVRVWFPLDGRSRSAAAPASAVVG
ncbi:sensor histidine kinase [Ornithinimicrobium cerasi]|uniref:sensor histidine kinase n=1 Tax=Ornithinimicrobium cerasi TaxID=2248773 RepID=UPI000F00C64C|nr:histidine kinase [Ornithinimicrobium cerasi]